MGGRVEMVGDGIGDFLVFVRADIGIAIGAGMDVVVELADIVMIKDDPRDVAKLIILSWKIMKKMNENLVQTMVYNVIVILVADGVLTPIKRNLVATRIAFNEIALENIHLYTSF
ncbi:MAG: hypothetical protein QXH84_05160 [Thermosphaera sp.]